MEDVFYLLDIFMSMSSLTNAMLDPDVVKTCQLDCFGIWA